MLVSFVCLFAVSRPVSRPIKKLQSGKIWEGFRKEQWFLSWLRTWFQRFHVPNIVFRTCSEHIPNVQDCYFQPESPYGMPLRSQIWEIPHFQELFTLLVFEKSNSQNRHIYNFHAPTNPDTNIPWESGSMFRTCSEHLRSEHVLGQLRI